MMSLCPASMSRRAIGCPMLPSPMKPMSMCWFLYAMAGRRLCPTQKPSSSARCARPAVTKWHVVLIISLLIISHSTKSRAMPQQPLKREFAFTIMDVARLLKTYADQRARQFGISRAQWAVLIRIDRNEGLKQTELADMLDLQPITLTRLLDRLSDNGLIERRADPNDRRANRLYLM